MCECSLRKPSQAGWAGANDATGTAIGTLVLDSTGIATGEGIRAPVGAAIGTAIGTLVSAGTAIGTLVSAGTATGEGALASAGGGTADSYGAASMEEELHPIGLQSSMRSRKRLCNGFM